MEESTVRNETDNSWGNEEETAGTTSEAVTEAVDDTENVTETAPAAEKTEEAAGTVDYDLTQMSSEMIYATVYQMMMTPDAYEGKTFRIDGTFYASYYEPTQQYYYYCVIQDATACCAQGLEFVWEDGSHSYPEEYPEEYAEIVVEGTFETYREEGDDGLYCRLRDAKLECIGGIPPGN